MRTAPLITMLSALAFLGLAAAESLVADGRPAFLATAALADDDDDDDDDDRPRRGRMMFYGDDDDDDDGPAYRPRRPRAEPPRRRAAPRARPEIVASNLDPASLDRLRAAGFTVLAERRLALLPGATARLSPPPNLSDARARARVSELAAGALVGTNALYRPNAGKGCRAETCFPYSREDWAVAACGARGVVGMIDTRVDAAHPALLGRSVETLVTRGDGRQPSSPAHGTEVAILLASERAEPDDLKLVAVDAFHRVGGADRTDVFDLVAAIDALVARGVKVVNLSLAGPANPVLERAGATAAERGVLLVAAVGNEGPKAKPLYPAAYAWAVGVTAIDARGEPYARAGRGRHVAFSAPGVRLELPDEALAPGRTRSGTSYAAPLVTAALSAIAASGAPSEAVTRLASHVEDRGAPGRDPVYGWGALTSAKGCPIPSVTRAD